MSQISELRAEIKRLKSENKRMADRSQLATEIGVINELEKLVIRLRDEAIKKM